MGTKCLILLLPSPVMSYRTQVRARQGSSLEKKKQQHKVKIIIFFSVLPCPNSPSSVVSLCLQGFFMILIEELGQLYQFIAPVSLWFSYLISYQEADGFFGVTLSILLALFYLILKVKPLKRNTNLFNSCRLVFLVFFLL